MLRRPDNGVSATVAAATKVQTLRHRTRDSATNYFKSIFALALNRLVYVNSGSLSWAADDQNGTKMSSVDFKNNRFVCKWEIYFY